MLLLFIKAPIGLNNMEPKIVVWEFVANPIVANMDDIIEKKIGALLWESTNDIFKDFIIDGRNIIYIYKDTFQFETMFVEY